MKNGKQGSWKSIPDKVRREVIRAAEAAYNSAVDEVRLRPVKGGGLQIIENREHSVKTVR